MSRVVIGTGQSQNQYETLNCYYAKIKGKSHIRQHSFSVKGFGPLSFWRCLKCRMWILWVPRERAFEIKTIGGAKSGF